MYYTHPCPYCRKIFYTFNDDRERAAQILFDGIKSHLIEYDEDDREYEMDERRDLELDQMYTQMREADERPYGGYEL